MQLMHPAGAGSRQACTWRLQMLHWAGAADFVPLLRYGSQTVVNAQKMVLSRPED